MNLRIGREEDVALVEDESLFTIPQDKIVKMVKDLTHEGMN